ncbi:DCL family protein [Bradyrhizobium sp. 25ACV]
MGGRSKPVELATRSFEKQCDATAFFKAMLNRYRPGERVSDEDGLDVATLLERHTEYVAKVGCGVSHFQVMMTEHGTQCFRIIRTDGSGTDFSYPHCISQRPPSRKQEVAQAFRRAVRFDLYKARDSFFAVAGASRITSGVTRARRGSGRSCVLTSKQWCVRSRVSRATSAHQCERDSSSGHVPNDRFCGF